MYTGSEYSGMKGQHQHVPSLNLTELGRTIKIDAKKINSRCRNRDSETEPNMVATVCANPHLPKTPMFSLRDAEGLLMQ